MGKSNGMIKYLFGSNDGDLFLLLLRCEGDNVRSLIVEKLGVTSICETMTYLENGRVFIGSSFGDSQYIQLEKIPDASGSLVKEIERYPNIGPILDMSYVHSQSDGGQCKVQYCMMIYL
jgi:DNA damage-binding protein 1